MYRIAKPLKIGTVGAVLMFLAAGVAAAQQQGQQANSATSTEKNVTAPVAHEQPVQAVKPGTETPYNLDKLDRASKLIGMTVINKTGEQLGTIEDLVLDPHDMSVSYGVLSYGGLLGVKNKLFAVPWSEFQMHPEKKAFVLDVNKEALAGATGFERNRWPEMASKDWVHQSGMYSEERPTVARKENAGTAESRMAGTMAIPVKYRRVSELIGLRARDNQGRQLGQLQDVMIDVQRGNNEGRVAYGVVAIWTGFLDLKRDLATVPWTAVQVLPKLHAVRLNATRESLKAVAFDESHFPNLQDPRYVRELNQRFGTTPYWEALGYTPSENRENRPASSTIMKPAQQVEMASAIGDVAAWRADSSYNRLFNASLVTTFEGTVEKVGTFRPESNAVEGLRLTVKASDGSTVIVHAGPLPYVERQNLEFHYGDRVTITGVSTEIGWRHFFMASTIQRGSDTLLLRSKDGTPKWLSDEWMKQVPPVRADSGRIPLNQPQEENPPMEW